MKIIRLTRGLVTVVDDDDYAALAAHRWIAKDSRGFFYAARNVGHETIFMHRVLVPPGAGQVVDHVDGATLNNQRANLRACTGTENHRNVHARRSGSGFKGVNLMKRPYKLARPWQAKITIGGQHAHLGYFATADEAARAYDTVARRQFGQFANCNFRETDPCTQPQISEGD